MTSEPEYISLSCTALQRINAGGFTTYDTLNNKATGNDLPKSYVVLKALNRFGQIQGKKALQKILYVNLERKVFLYQWNSYGPYSEEVKYMSEGMVINGQIRIEPRSLSTSGRTQFNMVLTEDGKKHLASIGTMPELDSRIEFVHRLLDGKTPREMELLASVHYIASYEDGKYSDRIFDIITELKPNANFSQNNVDAAVQELQTGELLNPLSS